MNYIVKSIKYELIRGEIKKNNIFNFEYIPTKQPIIYLFFVACGTNMGDYAIVRAEKEYLVKILGKDIPIVEIKTSQTESAIDIIKERIQKKDIVVLSGGGYIGDEYIEVYKPLLRILKNFRDNKMIIFPQTIFFHKKRREQKFTDLCKRCNSLKIFVREKKSQNIFAHYGIQTALVPDIVLSQKPILHRGTSGILLCLRNDVEKRLKEKEIQLIKMVLNEYGKVIVSDTVLEERFPEAERFEHLDKMLVTFSESMLVITDRIHGMIFSYLTNTPCIVLGNYNHKVESEYEWLKKGSNIRFLKQVNSDIIRKLVTELLKCPTTHNKVFENEYASLEEAIKEYYE